MSYIAFCIGHTRGTLLDIYPVTLHHTPLDTLFSVHYVQVIYCYLSDNAQ